MNFKAVEKCLSLFISAILLLQGCDNSGFVPSKKIASATNQDSDDDKGQNADGSVEGPALGFNGGSLESKAKKSVEAVDSTGDERQPNLVKYVIESKIMVKDESDKTAQAKGYEDGIGATLNLLDPTMGKVKSKKCEAFDKGLRQVCTVIQVVELDVIAEDMTFKVQAVITDTKSGESRRLEVESDKGPKSPWQNPDKPCNTNGDAYISPIDAALMASKLRNQDAIEKLEDEKPADAHFYDVDGDWFVTESDALLVIACLNNSDK